MDPALGQPVVDERSTHGFGAELMQFEADVAQYDPVTITGLSTRGGPVSDVRTVGAPSGIRWLRADEMTVCCGAGTPMAEIDEALAAVGQTVAIAPSGSVGGALAVGRGGVRQLGYGPPRDAVLQIVYVSAAGRLVKAGGPTVKNVSGFDLCRLLVGSCGTLGFMAEVILRTRPRATFEQWYRSRRDPWQLLEQLYRPTSILWDGDATWVLLEGDRRDVDGQVLGTGLVAADPPEVPTGGRASLAPDALARLEGRFLAQIGVGIVHLDEPTPQRSIDPVVEHLNRRLKALFDPTGRLNPGRSVLHGR